jgi:hypothetical protein
MPSQNEHNPLLTLGLNSNENDGGPSEKILSKRMGPLEKKHHPNKSWTKGKTTVKECAHNKCST